VDAQFHPPKNGEISSLKLCIFGRKYFDQKNFSEAKILPPATTLLVLFVNVITQLIFIALTSNPVLEIRGAMLRCAGLVLFPFCVRIHAE